MAIGLHIVASLYGCPKGMLEKARVVRRILRKTASEAKFNTVGEKFHQFKPFGVTGIILLAESHISIHTWPEKSLAAVDIFTCGKEGNAREGLNILCKYLCPKKVKKKVISR